MYTQTQIIQPFVLFLPWISKFFLILTSWPRVIPCFQATVSTIYLWKYTTKSSGTILIVFRHLELKSNDWSTLYYKSRYYYSWYWLHHLFTHGLNFSEGWLENRTNKRLIYPLQESGLSICGTVYDRHFLINQIIWNVTSALVLDGIPFKFKG